GKLLDLENDVRAANRALQLHLQDLESIDAILGKLEAYSRDHANANPNDQVEDSYLNSQGYERFDQVSSGIDHWTQTKKEVDAEVAASTAALNRKGNEVAVTKNRLNDASKRQANNQELLAQHTDSSEG